MEERRIGRSFNAIISHERKLGKFDEIEGRIVTRIILLFGDRAFRVPFS